MNTRTPTSVVIIDDHPLFRKGVSQLLALNDELQLIGEPGSRHLLGDRQGHMEGPSN